MIPARRITVLLAEDHAIVRQGLRTLLESDGRFKVIGEAQTGRESVALALSLRPAVIVMDIAMPVLNGLEASRQILTANPTAKIIILSAHSDAEYVQRAIETGVAGFLEKQSSAEILAQAILGVADGNRFFSPSIAKRQSEEKDRTLGRDGFPQPRRAHLTSRETEVLQLVAEGYANKQIAGELKISIKTVEKHRQHVMDKLDVHETAGLTRYAMSQGIVENHLRSPIA